MIPYGLTKNMSCKCHPHNTCSICNSEIDKRYGKKTARMKKRQELYKIQKEVEVEIMKVDIEKLIEAKKVLTDFNKLDLKDVELYENGIKINLNEEILNEISFTGLNNSDLIIYEFYKL